MSQIFIPAPGRLLAVKTDHPRALIIDVGPVSRTGILTRLSIEQSVAAQFQPSLDKVVYVTPFGDNVGTMTVDMILNTGCDTGDDNASKFIDNYLKTRLSPDNAEPVDLTIGSKAFSGYAIGFTLDGDANNGHLIRGQMKYVAWSSL